MNRLNAIILSLALIGFVSSSEVKETKADEEQRDKREFDLSSGHPSHFGSHFGHLGSPLGGSGLLFGTQYGHGHIIPHLAASTIKGAAKTAALAAARHVKAAQLSKAAHAAQAVAYDEASLGAKTEAALKAAQTTQSLIANLAHDLGVALSQAEGAAVQAGKSVEAAHAVETAQRFMVHSAQKAANALIQQRHISLSQLKAAQAVAASHPHVPVFQRDSAEFQGSH